MTQSNTKTDFRMPTASKWRAPRAVVDSGDEGFIGRSEAAFGNAEHWERVLGWLDAYLGRESSI